MVAADPIGPPEKRAQVLDEFLLHCREQGWGVAFLAVREADAPLYRERGMHAIYLGDEAMLRCDTFTLEGGAMKPVREAVNRVGARPHVRADARVRGRSPSSSRSSTRSATSGAEAPRSAASRWSWARTSTASTPTS